MQVFVTTAYTPPASAVPSFHEHAARDRFKEHRLTDDPNTADIILFVDARADQNDWRMTAMRRHPLTRAFPEKTFVFCEMDQPWCGMPGVYTSMPRANFDPQRQRSCGYHILRLGEAMARRAGEITEPGYLFSFMGRSLPGAREAVLRLRDQRGLIEDTSRYNFFGDDQKEEMARQEQRYQDVILDSKFVLCPAGAGPSSIRLFESLGAGRVPVIIADEWVEPDGPDWKACSVRVAEKDVARTPAILRQIEPRWAEMALAARETYAQFFAPDAVFHRLVESCRDIQGTRKWSERWQRYKPSRRYLRLWLREAKTRLLRR